MNLLKDINNPLWEEKGIIYCYTNLTNGKKYIGQTIKTLKHRHLQHINESKNKKMKMYNYHIHRAFRKHGLDNFSLEILVMNCQNYDKLNQYETFYIKRFKTLSIQNGYNMCEGGKNCNKIACKTEDEIKEIRRKQSNSLKGEKHPLYGTKLSEETKRKISESEKGKKISKESIQKAIESRKGYRHSEETKEKIRNSNLGKNVSDETKKKMSESKKGIKPEKAIKSSAEKRKVQVIRISNDNKIKFYSCAKDVYNDGFDSSTVCKCCKKLKKYNTHKGYKWMYVEEYYKYILELD